MTSTPSTPAGAVGRSAHAEVSDAGLFVHDVPAEPVLVHFDNQYIWAFTPGREGVQRDGGTWVDWPKVLLPYLEGSTRVRLATVEDRSVYFDAEHVFGDPEDPEERVVFASPTGTPYSIDKVGHITRSFLDTSEEIKHEILEATRTVLDELINRCKVDAYLSYGALLGAIREGGMIAHDSDTDVCYFSHHTNPADIILENYRIERELKQLGWEILRMSGGDIKVLWMLSDGRKVHIDIFSAFKIDGVFYQLGNRNGDFDLADLLPLGTVAIDGVEFPAPRNPEAMLTYIYGPSWRVPDPAFTYYDDPRGTRRLDGWLRGFRTEMGAWTEVFSGPEGEELPTGPSDFARWVHDQLPADAPILDLGAGNGRDTLWFLQQGHPVRAQDFSRYALKVIRRTLRSEGIPRKRYRVQQLILNETRQVLQDVADLSRDPRHLYARQLIGCLDEAARDNLFLLASKVLRGGQKLFLEFSATVDDPEVAMPAPVPLVRRFDPAWLTREIEAAGGRVEHLEVAPGVDMFDNPDPAVARMRVSWPHPKEKRR